MTSSSGDLYAQLYDPWVIKRTAALAQSEEADKRDHDEQAFRSQWMAAYRTDNGPKKFEIIADQLLALRGQILSRFWDFHLSSLLGKGQYVSWNLAAITLWHVSRGERAIIQQGLAHTAALVNDIEGWHCDIYSTMTFKTGLPHTPPFSQADIARIAGETYDKFRRSFKANRWTTLDGNKSQRLRRWKHVDNAIQGKVLMKIREKWPQKLWPEIL